MLCVFASTGCSQTPSPERHSILKAKGDTIVVLLLDAASASPMAGVAVEVWSDNGIVCERSPCPTNGIAWKSMADDAGKIHVPHNVFQWSMSVTAGEHYGDLAKDAYENPNGGWVLDMLLHDTADVSRLPIKLVDARSGRPVANQKVHIDYRTPLFDRDTMTLTSSGLGYIFVPSIGVTGSFEDVWVVAPGYRRTRIDLDDPHQTTQLRRQ